MPEFKGLLNSLVVLLPSLDQLVIVYFAIIGLGGRGLTQDVRCHSFTRFFCLKEHLTSSEINEMITLLKISPVSAE